MKVFFDTNILLDVFAHREPHYDPSVAVWTLAEQRKIQGYVSVISYTNIFYIIHKYKTRRDAQQAMTVMRSIYAPVECDEQILNRAIDSGFDDLEDAIQYFCAQRAKANCLITRNQGHFPRSGDIPVLTPAEFLAAKSFA